MTLPIHPALGLPIEPHGTNGQLRVLSPTGIPMLILTPRGVVGGGVSWSVALILESGVLREKGKAAA